MSADNISEDIAQAFFDSWDDVEQFYDHQAHLPDSFQPNPTDAAEQEFFQKYLSQTAAHYAWLKSILNLIRELRTHGYNRQFRAGTSLYTLILSRSCEYGLRNEQPRLYFQYIDGGGTNIAYFKNVYDEPLQIILEQAAFTPEVQQLLERLMVHPID